MLLRRYHKKAGEAKVKTDKKTQDAIKEFVKNNPDSIINSTELENIVKEKSIKTLKVEELKDLAKEKGIKGYSSMNKTELISALAGD